MFENTLEPPESAVIVAHPDDETIWAGGALLTSRLPRLKIATLCRGGDRGRAPRFYRAVEHYRAVGAMADLDDGPEQTPLDPALVQQAIVSLLAGAQYDLVYTHSPFGEYTRHRRHEETGNAVLNLWEQGALTIRQLRVFAYEDGAKRYLPRPINRAHVKLALPEEVWLKKQAIITKTYGFSLDSFEAQANPRTEAFWVFDSPAGMRRWLNRIDSNA